MNKKLISAACAAAFGFCTLAGASANNSGMDSCKFYFKANGSYAFTAKPKMELKSADVTASAKSSGPVANNVATAPFFDASSKKTEANTNVTESFSKKMKGFGVGAGIGYTLTDSIRSEIVVDYSKLDSKDSKKKNDPYLTQEMFRGMVNVAYDFHNSSSFVPYITGGIGIATVKHKYHVQHSGNVTLPTAALASGTTTSPYFGAVALSVGEDATKKVADEVKSKRKIGFAYQVGAGVGYKISDGVIAEVSYALSGTTAKPTFPAYSVMRVDNAKSGADGSAADKAFPGYTVTDVKKDKASVKRILQHDIKVGVRVAF